MSVVSANKPNGSSVHSWTACFDNNLVLSQGIFLGDNPLKFSLPLMMMEISIIFVSYTAINHLLRTLGQSRIVSQILTGILLGRSVIGRSFFFRSNMFPIRGILILDTFSVLSFILFLFSIGVKTDLGQLKKSGKRAVAIGVASSIVPLALSMGIYNVFKTSIPTDLTKWDLILRLALRLSLSSHVVVADTLDELGLLNSELGRVTMSATLITDTVNSLIGIIFLIKDLIATSGADAPIWLLLVPLVVPLLLILIIARPMTILQIKRTLPGELLHGGAFVGVTLWAIFAGWATEVGGYHFTLGPFMLGLFLPAGMPLGVTCRERLDSFVIGLFLPLYPVLAGYRTHFSMINNFAVWGSIELIFIICYVGKLIGSMLASLYFKMPVRDALIVGLMMNIKGIIEIGFFYSWGQGIDQMATAEHFSMLMVAVLLNIAVTTPLIKYLYNPSARYVARKWRTIQHAKPNRQLQVITCVHNEDNVPSLLDLLQASNPSQKAPISVTVLHLKELIGQAASLIRPYKRSKRRSNITSSDRIVNAFRYFEQQSEGVVSVSPYVAIAPYATMHNDVCALAYNKKAQLIILPFHKQSDGVHETANNTIRIVNISVLDRAPCSVAVLVDRGLPAATFSYASRLLQRVVVYFFGGADDREALAYGMRMARAGSISLTVVLFIKKGEAPLNDEVGARLDEEMLLELMDQRVKNSSITYVKKVVADGEGMVEVVQSMSEKFDFLIVGRRKDVECELTRGMSEWIECPELGIVGDLLASTDFGEKVTILVVQRQRRVPVGVSVHDRPKAKESV